MTAFAEAGAAWVTGGGATDSEEMAQEIDEELYEEIYRLIDDAHQRAARVLLNYRAALDEIAAILVEHETIDKDQFERRLLSDEPASDVLNDDVPSTPTASAKPERAHARTSNPRRTPRAKPHPDTVVARTIDPDDPTS